MQNEPDHIDGVPPRLLATWACSVGINDACDLVTCLAKTRLKPTWLNVPQIVSQNLGSAGATIETGPEEPLEDGEMNQMALLSTHMQDSKFEPWRSEVAHATFRSWRFPTMLNLYK